jgi:hypothetical protein
MATRGARLGFATILAAVLVFASSQPAQAETFNVTNTNDEGPGSLRQAILDANARRGRDTITISPEARGKLALLSDLPPITDDLSIVGPGAQNFSILVPNGGIGIQVDGGSQVSVSALSVVGDDIQAVAVNGSLRLFSVLVRQNALIPFSLVTDDTLVTATVTSLADTGEGVAPRCNDGCW